MRVPILETVAENLHHVPREPQPVADNWRKKDIHLLPSQQQSQSTMIAIYRLFQIQDAADISTQDRALQEVLMKPADGVCKRRHLGALPLRAREPLHRHQAPQQL